MNADLIEELHRIAKVGFGYDISKADRVALTAAAAALAAKDTALSEIAQQLEQTRVELGETQLVLATTEHNCTAALSGMRSELEAVRELALEDHHEHCKITDALEAELERLKLSAEERMLLAWMLAAFEYGKIGHKITDDLKREMRAANRLVARLSSARAASQDEEEER